MDGGGCPVRMVGVSLLLLLLTALSISTTEAGVVRAVWVVRGERAELPCAPSPKHKQDSALLVLWYRYSDTVPVYSYDAREGEFTSGVRWADEGELGGRARFIPSSEPPTLALDPVHASDEGVYTCRVDYILSPSTTAVVNLTVVIPPGPPTILWGGRGVVGVVGPLGEGERAELTCRSTGGRPPPTLTWTRRGQRLQPILYNVSKDSSTGTYTVEADVGITGTRDLLGSTLSCLSRTPTRPPHLLHAQHHYPPTLSEIQTASVVVNITLPPVDVRILGFSGSASAGSELRLVCRAAGSHPPAQVVWWKGHTRLKQVTHAIEAGGNVSTATLTMLVSRSHHGATLVCTASNPALPHAHHLSDTIKLNVYYPPVVRLAMGANLDPSSLKAGDDVYFECSIQSNPPYMRVHWYHNGDEVVHNVTGDVVVSGLSLVLRHLGRSQSGSYTCGATNIEGHNTSNAVVLSLRHAPVCAGDGREKTQGAARGSTAAVRCRVEAHPSNDLAWTWIRKKVDGSEEEVRENVRSDGVSSSVLVTPHTPEDYGRFLCLATNSVGRQEAACVVNLVPAGPPDTPTNCSVTPVEPNATERNKAALRIVCLAGFDGGLPQLFTLETWQDSVLAANMTNSTPQWMVEGLRAGVGVTLRVAAYNSRGRSDAIRFEVHTASAQQHAAPGSKWGFLGVPPLLGAIVGVGGVLLIILVAGVIVVKYNRRPQPAAHVHTLIMTPARPPDPDTYDPDVVSSLRCHTNDNLDVLPQKTTTTTTTTAISTEGKPAQGQQEQGQGQGQIQGQGQRQGRGGVAGVEGRHHKHTSFSQRFCLHRQDSPFPDSDCVDSDSDSDSTFIDLTAAGRAASILPPAGRHCHSLPRPGKRGDIHVAAASLDLQLRACQTSQIVATPDGMIHRIPCMYRNPRRPFPSSSEELRHLTSSVEELHPLIFSRDIRNFLSSADMRHLSFSGTELRMMPPMGTWPPLVSSGELRLPLSTSGTLQSITTEEFRLMPSSSGSSPWDSQTTPTFTRLPSDHHHHHHQVQQQVLSSSSSASTMAPSSVAAAHPQTSAAVPSTTSQVPVKQIQVQTSQHLQSHPAFVEMHPPIRVDPQTQPYPSQPHPTPDSSQHHQPTSHLSSQTLPCHPDTQTHHTTKCSEPQQKWHVCATKQGAPPLPSEPQVSLRELQPPPPRPSGELEPLLSVIELQPPPSFREPTVTIPQHDTYPHKSDSDTCPHKPDGMSSITLAPENIHIMPSSVSLGVSSNEHKIRFSSEREFMSSHVASDAMKDEKPQLSKRNVFGLTVEIPRPQTTKQAGKVPMTTAHCDAPTTDMSIEDNLRTSSPGNTTQSLRKEFKKKGKQVTFSDEETLTKPVVARVPSKSSEVSKSEKRCGQLFTSIDLSSPSRSQQGGGIQGGNQGSVTLAPSPQKGVAMRSPQKHMSTAEHHRECLRRGGSLEQGGFGGEVHGSCPLRRSSQSSPVT